VKLLRRYVRVLIEQIGRNYHTIDTNPYSFEDYPGIDTEIFPMSNGERWFAQVEVEFDDSLSTPLRVFASEEDAKSFARKHAEEANRVRMSKDIDTNTETLHDLIDPGSGYDID
jgi:hypothetical protein